MAHKREKGVKNVLMAFCDVTAKFYDMGFKYKFNVLCHRELTRAAGRSPVFCEYIKRNLTQKFWRLFMSTFLWPTLSYEKGKHPNTKFFVMHHKK